VAVWACLALAFARATVVVSKLAFFAIPDILLEEGPVREYSFPRNAPPRPRRGAAFEPEKKGRAGTEQTHRGETRTIRATTKRARLAFALTQQPSLLSRA
jgi:hypothetical protein